MVEAQQEAILRTVSASVLVKVVVRPLVVLITGVSDNGVVSIENDFEVSAGSSSDPESWHTKLTAEEMDFEWRCEEEEPAFECPLPPSRCRDRVFLPCNETTLSQTTGMTVNVTAMYDPPLCTFPSKTLNPKPQTLDPNLGLVV